MADRESEMITALSVLATGVDASDGGGVGASLVSGNGVSATTAFSVLAVATMGSRTVSSESDLERPSLRSVSTDRGEDSPVWEGAELSEAERGGLVREAGLTESSRESARLRTTGVSATGRGAARGGAAVRRASGGAVSGGGVSGRRAAGG